MILFRKIAWGSNSITDDAMHTTLVVGLGETKSFNFITSKVLLLKKMSSKPSHIQ